MTGKGIQKTLAKVNLSIMKKYRLNEIDGLPARPGIYAWYASVQIGTSDWEKILDSTGKDTGKDNLKNLLSRHTQRFSPPSVNVTINGSFRDSWSGRVSPERYSRFVDAINANPSAEELDNFQFPTKEMERVFDKEIARARLARLLTEVSTPLFASPLYIGKSDNLKQRISEHSREIEKWHSVAKRDPSNRDKIKTKIFNGRANDQIPDIFATRAVACGFTPENLEIYIFDISEELQIPIEQAKDLAAIFEWFLNTWNRPIFGRA